jgi:hypothetical protein
MICCLMSSDQYYSYSSTSPKSPPLFLCLSQGRTLISNMRGDCSFCWYWWNCWPSLFKLSFHKQLFFSELLEMLHEAAYRNTLGRSLYAPEHLISSYSSEQPTLSKLADWIFLLKICRSIFSHYRAHLCRQKKKAYLPTHFQNCGSSKGYKHYMISNKGNYII